MSQDDLQIPTISKYCQFTERFLSVFLPKYKDDDGKDDDGASLNKSKYNKLNKLDLNTNEKLEQLDHQNNKHNNILTNFSRSSSTLINQNHNIIDDSTTNSFLVVNDNDNKNIYKHQVYYTNILDLPPEIFRIIIYFIYSSGSSIIPIITCCKELYEKYAYLIYMTKVVHLNLDDSPSKHLFSRSFLGLSNSSSYSNKSKETLKYLSNHKNDVTYHIPVLNITSNVSNSSFLPSNSNSTSFTSSYAINNIPLLAPLLFDTLPSMKNLVVLTIDADNPFILFQSLNHLPPNIQVFRLFIQFTKHQLGHIDQSTISIDLNKLSTLSKLESFELESKKFALVSRHIHPELIPFRWNPNLSEQTSFNQFFANKLLKTYNRLMKKSNSLVIKNKIGEIIYYFLQKNQSNLIKIDLTGFDINLIFNSKKQLPFHFEKLRMLFLDNCSRIMNQWLPIFQINNQIQTFGNRYPLVVFYDRLGQRIYFRDTKIDSENSSVTEIENWKYSDHIATTYALLNRKLKIKY